MNAGEYIAKAIINNANFLLEREQSISFTIAKIAQPTPLVIDHIEDIDYSVTSMDLTASGGDGEGALRFDAISGQARVEGNKLYIEGTGEVKLRAVKEESQNYLAQYSPTVSFRVNKGVLRAILDDITIEYGDTPIIEIRYEGYLRNEQSKNDIKGTYRARYLYRRRHGRRFGGQLERDTISVYWTTAKATDILSTFQRQAPNCMC